MEFFFTTDGVKITKETQEPRAKLLQVRKALGLTQSEMLRRLGTGQSSQTARISKYESGTREPSYSTLLAYGRIAQILVLAMWCAFNDG